MITSSKRGGVFPKDVRHLLLFSLCSAAAFIVFGSCVSNTAPAPVEQVPLPEAVPAAVLPELSETQLLLTRAAELMGRRDFPGALALFDRLPADDAEKPEIQILRASALNAAGRPAEARVIAAAISASEPANTDALLVLADAAAIEGKDRERRTFLEQILKADPKNLRALTDMGNIALRSQSLRTAAGYFYQALAADPGYGEALIGRAIVYRYSREPKQAEQLFIRAAGLYPQWASPLHERARLYKGAGFNAEALEDLNAAKRLEPDNYWILVDRGITLVEMNRKSEALEEFSRAVVLDPGNFYAYVYSAGIKDEAGDIDGAERDYAALVKLKPEYYFGFEGLGMIKMRNQRWAEARDAFLEAYNQAPKEYTYALLAAVSWIKAGRPSDPKQFLAQVLRTAPRDSTEYTILRLYHDMSGDLDAVVKTEREQNLDTRAKMLFYLAFYYDIKGNKNLADKYFLQVQDLGRIAIPEWRLNKSIIEERGIKAF
jgi:tetratricopeptide (TPR) repeat protein